MWRRCWRRVAGAARCAAWLGVLWLVSAPWDGLGGLVAERLRWLQRFVLGAGLLAGATAGALAGCGRRPRRRLLRRGLLALGAAAAVLMTAFEALGRPLWVLVALTGFLAVWAGVDLETGARPLLAQREAGDGEDAPVERGGGHRWFSG